MSETTIEIADMSCNHCVQAVTRALQSVQGIASATVRIGSATVRFDPTQVTLDMIQGAIRDAGFEPRAKP